MLHFPSLRPCILSTLSIHYAYISSVLTVSFNGIKQIQQLYQFLHIHFQHFNWFDWSHLLHNFHALSSIIPISTVLSITISLEHSNSFFIATMPLIWFHFINSYSSINFFRFLLIPWVSLIPSIPPFPFHQFNSSCFIRSISTIICIVSNHRIQQFHQVIQFHQLQQVNQYSKWSLFCQFSSLYNYY